MIEGRTFSVIVTNYRERGSLRAIIEKWLMTSADEVILADCSGALVGDSYFRTILPKAEPRFRMVSFTHDFGTKTDYALALLTQGDFVILGDDDVMPSDSFVDDLYNGWKEVGGGLIGVIGRTFHGVKYKGDTKFYSALLIDKPVRVGFVGVVYFAERKFFGFDPRGLKSNNVDDLFWCMEVFPEVPKYVVPVKSFMNLPEASDKDCMFHNPVLKKERQDYYEKMYKKNYLPRGRSV